MRVIVTPIGCAPLPAMTLAAYRDWLYHHPTVQHAVRKIELVAA